jgi:hypothetical protein
MIEIRIFVEGLTERLFVEKILYNYFSNKWIRIFWISYHKKKVTSSNIQGYTNLINAPSKPTYCFIIHQCEGVGSISYQVNQLSLTTNTFDYLITLRDLSRSIPPPPIKPIDSRAKIEESVKHIKDKITDFDKNTHKIKSDKLERMEHFFAVMEIEAWFLKEIKFLIKIDDRLTPEYIKQKLDIDLYNDDVELYKKPSKDLDNIYKRVGLTYNKREDKGEEIVKYLDYDQLFTNARKDMPHLNNLIEFIENCNCITE